MQTLKPLHLVQRTFEAVRLHGRCTAQRPINLSANGSASSYNYLSAVGISRASWDYCYGLAVGSLQVCKNFAEGCRRA